MIHKIEKTKIKRNKAVYDLYAIEGYPNTFLSFRASDKFNGSQAVQLASGRFI